MTAITAEQKQQLDALCRQFGVRQLDLFGSGTGPAFHPERSDLDFLVEFEPAAPRVASERYFGLLAALQDLFGRDVDLVELGAIQNPYFLKHIQQARQVLYAA